MSTLILTMPTSAEHSHNYEHPHPSRQRSMQNDWPAVCTQEYDLTQRAVDHARHPSSSRGTLEVVARLGTSTDTVNALKKELSFYQQLRRLQGECIPKCFGYFCSTLKDQAFVYLVLEYSSKPICSIYDTQEDVPLALRCAFSLVNH